MAAKTSRKTKVWTETERLGAIVVAVREGVPEAAKRTKVPERTIYQWLQDAGGVAEIRALANMRTEEAVSAAVVAICNEAARRAGKLSDDQLMITIRLILEGQTSGNGNNNADAQAGAQASAAIHNWTINVGED